MNVRPTMNRKVESAVLSTSSGEIVWTKGMPSKQTAPNPSP
jgi:hypothetical protein